MMIDAASDNLGRIASNDEFQPIYLDCNATTPIDPRVLDEVVQYLQEDFGNSGSRTHTYGQRAKQRINRAREEVAAVAAANADEVIFTSGATESNNLAILGLEAAGRSTGRMHIISTLIEHKAVLEPLELLQGRGFEVTLVPPTAGGWVDPGAISEALRPDTLLVSVMAANNETGVVQPIEEISNILATHQAYFHVDAAQAFGKAFPELQNTRVDLISVSGHKIFAPKGVGALVMRRRGYKRVPLTALTVGGGQERGLRPGTLPVALIAGLGVAARIALQENSARVEHCTRLRDGLLQAIRPLNAVVNGDLNRMLPHTVNFSVPGVDSEAAIVALKDLVAISNGSACTSQSYDASHVLMAMDLPSERISGALRFSWSHLTSEPDWSAVVQRLQEIRQH